MFGQRLLHRVRHGFALIAGIHQFVGFAIILGMNFGVFHHALDFIIGQAGVGLDGDLVFLAGSLVLGGYVEDAVGVDIEGDLDLRRAALCRRNVGQVELAQALVAGRHFALALQHVDRHRALIVVGGGEHLAGLGRDGGVLLDQLGHHAAHRLDAQRQRGDVEQQHVRDFALQHAGLNGSADGNGFIGVHVLARFAAEELLDLLLHLGHPRHAADQDHVGNVAHLDAGILDRDAAGLDGTFDQFIHQ